MDNITKQKIMEEIERKALNFQKVSSIQYRIRCPICGDSQKKSTDAHCYIKCSYDANEPLLYNCFLCNSHGMVNKKFLESLGCKTSIIDKAGTQRFNRLSIYKNADVNIITGEPRIDSPQTDYLHYRLGKIPDDILDNLKVIWDLNLIYPYITDRKILNTMPNNRESISFLSDDKTTILTRAFNSDTGRWRKIHILPNSGKSMYTIKGQFDLFTSTFYDQGELSDLCIAEGIMDIISVYVNESMSPNSAYIAILGSDYVGGLEYALSKGIFGKGIRVHIYIDDGIDINTLSDRLKKYKWLYNSIEICKNLKYKDMGITPDKIKVSRRKV